VLLCGLTVLTDKHHQQHVINHFFLLQISDKLVQFGATAVVAAILTVAAGDGHILRLWTALPSHCCRQHCLWLS